MNLVSFFRIYHLLKKRDHRRELTSVLSELLAKVEGVW